jgi:hypothetical protein
MARSCCGCGARVVPELPGVYYCDACVAEQLREHAAERRAFEEFHAFADAVARGQHDPRGDTPDA